MSRADDRRRRQAESIRPIYERHDEPEPPVPAAEQCPGHLGHACDFAKGRDYRGAVPVWTCLYCARPSPRTVARIAEYDAANPPERIPDDDQA